MRPQAVEMNPIGPQAIRQAVRSIRPNGGHVLVLKTFCGVKFYFWRENQRKRLAQLLERGAL